MSWLGSMSLERKLPLLMTAVLAIVMSAAVVITYRTLRETAELSARERMTRGAVTVTASVQEALRDRLDRLHELTHAGGPLVAAVRARDTRRMTQLLDAFRGADTATLEVWDAAMAPLLTLGPSVVAEERSTAFRAWLSDPSTAALLRDSASATPLYHWNGRVLFWFVAPVKDGGRTIGYVAHKRRLSGSRQFISSFTELVGENAEMQIRNRANDFWATAPGLPAPRPERRDSSDRKTYDIMRDGTRMITTEVPLRGAPWFTVLHVPYESVMASPRATAMRLSVLASLLAAIGAFFAWVISRRITRPLTELSVVAASLAHGEAVARARIGTEDEVGRLGAAFNSMAEDIERSREELEQRTRDAEVAREEAERSNRAKADFLAVMSHELRTPLNAIAGYADLLRMGVYGELKPEQMDALARIDNNQQHLLALISDVLSFAKIDAGQVQFELTDIPVNDALAGVEPLVAPLLRAKSLEFGSPVCDAALQVRADSHKLQQVLLNLLANAIKFTGAGGSISVLVENDEHQVRIAVRDTGAGIPADRLARIFDPFDQGDRALNKPHEGVGLGLAIARELARGMGGDITVTSEVGQGSVFTVTLIRAGKGVRDAGGMAKVPWMNQPEHT